MSPRYDLRQHRDGDPPLRECDIYAAECYHQQYLSGTKNPGGYCGLGGTGAKPGDPFETNWGRRRARRASLRRRTSRTS